MATPAPGFPITRASLADKFSTALNLNLPTLEEHREDENFVRNKVNNLSILVIDQARMGRRNIAFTVPLQVSQEILSKLMDNFPDVQYVSSSSRNPNLSVIKMFWT